MSGQASPPHHPSLLCLYSWISTAQVWDAEHLLATRHDNRRLQTWLLRCVAFDMCITTGCLWQVLSGPLYDKHFAQNLFLCVRDNSGQKSERKITHFWASKLVAHPGSQRFQCMGPTGAKCTSVAIHHSFTCVTRTKVRNVRKQARPYHLMASILQIKASRQPTHPLG